jgi:hypothetical protein
MRTTETETSGKTIRLFFFHLPTVCVYFLEVALSVLSSVRPDVLCIKCSAQPFTVAARFKA